MKNPKLHAELGWNFGGEMHRVVSVYFGDTLIADLSPIRETRAGHGDDSAFHDAEDRAIIEETVAPYLKRLFATPVGVQRDFGE